MNGDDLRKAASPPFIIAAAVLLVTAASVHGVMWAMDWHLLKREVALQQPLILLDQELGPYAQTDERQLSREVLEEIGTEQYIYWIYEGSRGEARDRRVHLFLAYYSGMPEARPRVPERVQVALGLPDSEPDCQPFSLGSAAAGDGEQWGGGEPLLCMRSFRPPGERTAIPVAYTYIANGQMVGTPDDVHAILTDPHPRSVWWAKVEVRVDSRDLDASDTDAQRRAAEHFLRHAMPAIAEVLPPMSQPD